MGHRLSPGQQYVRLFTVRGLYAGIPRGAARCVRHDRPAALFGFSRGGLYAFRYAVTWPEDVLALYLDAPVLDIRSWPGGKGAGIGDPACWEECKRWYCLDEHSAWFFRDNPLDRIDELVRTGIPVLLVAGEADDVVPYAENGAVMAARMAAAGGRIHVILKPGVGHHPHSLEDPAPITAFMEAL